VTRPPLSTTIALAGLYLAQSVPLYLVAAALPAILRDRGVDLAVIGALGALLAPWVLKATWAPLIDRMARNRHIGRKGVVLVCQAITLGCIVTLSNLDPVRDAVRFFPILMAMSLRLSAMPFRPARWRSGC
jgi:PAT family beta-lactamase induction signal transducer AmpG